MNPLCLPEKAVENPVAIFFEAPRSWKGRGRDGELVRCRFEARDEELLTCTLHAGILLNPVRPPATPRIFVATLVPTTAERFGAMKDILDSTYCKICRSKRCKRTSAYYVGCDSFQIGLPFSSRLEIVNQIASLRDSFPFIFGQGFATCRGSGHTDDNYSSVRRIPSSLAFDMSCGARKGGIIWVSWAPSWDSREREQQLTSSFPRALTAWTNSQGFKISVSSSGNRGE